MSKQTEQIKSDSDSTQHEGGGKEQIDDILKKSESSQSRIEDDPDGDFNTGKIQRSNSQLMKVKKFSKTLENQMNQEDKKYKEMKRKPSDNEKGRVAQELAMAAAYYVNEDKKKPPKRSCLCIFKLETGIVAIVYLDVMMLIMIFMTTATSLVELSDTVDQKADKKSQDQSKDKGKASLYQREIDHSGPSYGITSMAAQSKESSYVSYFLFNIVSNYVTLVLYCMKIYFGLQFFYKVTFVGRMEQEFVMDKEGYQKWQTRLKVQQRKVLQKYYMQSVIFSRFAIVQVLSQLTILVNDLQQSTRLAFLLMYSILSIFYIHVHMENLLQQFNYEIRFWYQKFNDTKLRKAKVEEAGKQAGSLLPSKSDQNKDTDDFTIYKSERNSFNGSEQERKDNVERVYINQIQRIYSEGQQTMNNRKESSNSTKKSVQFVPNINDSSGDEGGMAALDKNKKFSQISNID